MTVDTATPQARVAQQFMQWKGLGSATPYKVEKLDHQPCWYFYYYLPDGHLELEVFWDAKARQWDTTVTSFRPQERQP